MVALDIIVVDNWIMTQLQQGSCMQDTVMAKAPYPLDETRKLGPLLSNY